MLFTVIYGVLLTVQFSTSHIERPVSDNSSTGTLRDLQIQQQIYYTNDALEPVTPSCHGLWIWIQYGYNDSNCQCGNRLGGIVQCDDKSLEVQLAVCYCMTRREEDLNAIVVDYFTPLP